MKIDKTLIEIDDIIINCFNLLREMNYENLEENKALILKAGHYLNHTLLPTAMTNNKRHKKLYDVICKIRWNTSGIEAFMDKINVGNIFYEKSKLVPWMGYQHNDLAEIVEEYRRMDDDSTE